MSTPPEDKALLERIVGRFDQADKGAHKQFRRTADRLYALYRNHTEWRDSLGTDRRDRDQGLREGQREWGAELFIPFSFTAVETEIPRMLATTPRVIVKPRNPSSVDNAPNMKLIVDSQYSAIDYELRLQDIARDALIGGLGVQKTYWNTRRAKGQKLKEGIHGGWVAEAVQRTLMDDPICERIDPYDFFWDPFAADVQACDWVIHRNWRSTDYCKRLFESGVWTYTDPEQAVRDLEMGPGGSEKYTEAWASRQKIDGTSGNKAKDRHEVWEYHDGEQVITVLNREHIVQQGPNPNWHGEFPFQVYRPTRLPGRMAGIGTIEPMVDLQEEINTLRSQRRDNATIVLQRSFFYQEGLIDPADFKVGPGLGIGVLGNPSEAIYPMPIGDIPNSGYQEENSLMADIMRTTGLDDTASGSGNGVQQTATGTQLVYQAQSARIKLKTRNLEVELVRAGGRQIMALNQQKIRGNRDVRIPVSPEPGSADQRWAWRQVGPNELAGEFDLEVEGGSMAPENVPQQRNDAQMMQGLVGSNQVNPEMGTRFVLKNMGIENPDGFMLPPQQQVPAEVIDRFADLVTKGGADPGVVQQAKAAALQPPAEKK